MPYRITKKALKALLVEYIEDGDKPTSQPDVRLNDFFDKISIVDESFLILKNIIDIKREEDLRRVFRLVMHMSEENANKYKRFKVISEDIAYAWSQLQGIVTKYL